MQPKGLTDVWSRHVPPFLHPDGSCPREFVPSPREGQGILTDLGRTPHDGKSVRTPGSLGGYLEGFPRSALHSSLRNPFFRARQIKVSCCSLLFEFRGFLGCRRASTAT